MKNTPLLLFILLSVFLSSQNKQFLYEYRFIPDSTNKTDIKSEIMILNIQKEKSDFYSSEQYAIDSIMMAETKLGKMAMPPEKETVRESVTKYPNSDQILYTTFIMYDKYKVKQDIKMQWKLHNEFSKILNYNVQKATTEFGGRLWTAWFSKDLPIQDGPYKFKGLPGLILKLEDSQENHIYELKGIRTDNNPFIYPDLKQYREFEMNYTQFVKKFKNYRKNPAADLVGRIPDQRDASGTLRTSDEIIREINKRSLERLAKDNNLIEIDLLK